MLQQRIRQPRRTSLTHPAGSARQQYRLLPISPEPAGLHDNIVDEWGKASFPASDPPSNW
jgi:hypothetical protein